MAKAKFKIGEYAFAKTAWDDREVYLPCKIIGVEETPLTMPSYSIKVLKYRDYGLSQPLFCDVPEYNLMRAQNYSLNMIPSRIIYNDPATIVFWEDGSKTIVKRAKGERFNKYNAFCAALAKKTYGNNSVVNKIVGSGVEQNTVKKGKKQLCRNK